MIILQTKHGISAAAIAEYTKGYAHSKSGFDAIRTKSRPKIPKDLETFNFNEEEYKAFKNTIHHLKFLQYDNSSQDNRILIFASEVGLRILSQSSRWQSDGTFFCAPKPFHQVYYIMGGKPGEKVLPVVFILMQKRTKL